eukprot:7998152-Alexandrium_andersonii.AAC.1
MTASDHSRECWRGLARSRSQRWLAANCMGRFVDLARKWKCGTLPRWASAACAPQTEPVPGAQP